MWRLLLITTMLLQQTLAAWLVPAAAPAKIAQQDPFHECCCCMEACESVSRACDSDAPRRCAPSSPQRPLNTDATTTRLDPRVRAGARAIDPTGESTHALLAIAHRRAQATDDSTPRVRAAHVNPDARTRRALLCVRTI